MLTRNWLDLCDKILTKNKDGNTVTINYVLYKKDGTKVVLVEQVKKVSDLAYKIAVLESEKSELVSVEMAVTK